MYPNDFVDLPTFPLVPTSGQNFSLSNTLGYGQIPAKLKTLPQLYLSVGADQLMLACYKVKLKIVNVILAKH